MTHQPQTDEQGLSVAERIESVLHLYRHSNGQQKITIAEICRQAGVNRANLYAGHRDLVEQILGRSIGDRQKKCGNKKGTPIGCKQENNRHLSNREKALLYMCLELNAEVLRLGGLQRQRKK